MTITDAVTRILGLDDHDHRVARLRELEARPVPPPIPRERLRARQLGLLSDADCAALETQESVIYAHQRAVDQARAAVLAHPHPLVSCNKNSSSCRRCFQHSVAARLEIVRKEAAELPQLHRSLGRWDAKVEKISTSAGWHRRRLAVLERGRQAAAGELRLALESELVAVIDAFRTELAEVENDPHQVEEIPVTPFAAFVLGAFRQHDRGATPDAGGDALLETPLMPLSDDQQRRDRLARRGR
jgi:hypothetical protein